MIFKLVQTEYYHLVDAISYFVGAIVPIYFIWKSKEDSRNHNNNDNPFRKQTIVLAAFMFSQGIYHIAGIAGLKLVISKGILEPLSAAVLLLFGLVYFVTFRKIRSQQQHQQGKEGEEVRT